MNSDDVLIYDIETQVFGKPDPTKDRMKLFACYSYKTKKYYTLKKIEDIQKVIDAHKFLVGFNNSGTKRNPGYDNPILIREGINFKYKIMIDLMCIFKDRAGAMKIKKGMLKDILMSYSLDYITRMLGLVDDDDGKLNIDYSVFRKETWTKEEEEEIRVYAIRDIEITMKLYEWVEDYFEGFKPFMRDEDVRKKSYLTVSIPKFAYKAICKAMKWEEKYADFGITDDSDSIKGGYVAYPAGEKFSGDIYCLDYNCLPKGTNIKMWRDCLQWYNKPIEKLKVGDAVVNNQGKQIIDNIKIQDYNDELIEIELENGKKISCTPNHMFPVFRDGKIINVKADNILSTDELLTRHSKRGHLNGHFKGGQIKKYCKVCNNVFKVFKSQEYIEGCSTKCSNILRSINSKKTNLGKNKDNCEWFARMSKERKGKPRSTLIKKNIAEGNRKATQKGKSKYFYGGYYFKSKNEVKVAQALDRDKIKWKYEPKVFTLPSGEVYTPDFYLYELDKWIEVKGTLILDTKSSGYRKFKEFIKLHPNSVLINNENRKQMRELLYGEN